MHRWTDITIDDCFVIHILDNRLADVQCSQALTPIPEPFRSDLRRYIQSVVRPAFRRKRFGRFRPDSPVLHEYLRLRRALDQSGIVETPLFLDISQRLATMLFAAMRPSPNTAPRHQPGDITPGDFLVGLFYPHAPQPSSVPCLYLIKVDLQSALQRQKMTLADGSLHTVLSPCNDLIPQLSTAHIQKTALIRLADDPATYDVMMTDPQGGKQGVARFFASDFLATEPFYTADQQAELLFRRTHAWVAEHEADLSPAERQEVLQTVRHFLSQSVEQAKPVLPGDLIETLPLSEPRPAPVINELRQSFEETITVPEGNGSSIPPGRELLIQALPPQVTRKRVIYQLDHGVQLSGEEEAIQQLFADPPHRVQQDTEFTIRTSTFRPVL